MASFFSGLASQAQTLVSEKIPGMGAKPEGEGGEVPADGAAPAEGAENGEVPAEGGAMGFMGGMMAKANAVKAAAAEKAGGLGGAAGGLQVRPTCHPSKHPRLPAPQSAPHEQGARDRCDHHPWDSAPACMGPCPC